MIVSDHRQFQDKSIEDVLCLSTLIAVQELGAYSELDESELYFRSLGEEGCNACPFNLRCLACVINQ